jgi:CTP:molybdopterin cytidylyltransferase MocA
MEIDDLASRLDVNLHSPGICYPCLSEFGRSGDHWFVVTLWAEGLGRSVAAALRAHPEAAEAQRDFDDRGCRSDIFRAVVRRLARDLDEHAKKATAATWN